MSDQEYLSALMVFIVSYTVFETPYNYMLRRFRPSRWLAFLMFGWGSMTMILAASHNFGTVVAIRFLLGAFEAGLFPGLLFCLTLWYKPEERALRIAFILVCATLAGAFGGAIPFGVGHINQAGGLQAWRWLFLIEGAPSCAAAFLVLLFFPDFPETEKWLSTGERELAVERLKGVGSLGHDKIVWIEVKSYVGELETIPTLSGVRRGVCPILQSVTFHPHHCFGIGIRRIRCAVVHCATLRCCFCLDCVCISVIRQARGAFTGNIYITGHCRHQFLSARRVILFFISFLEGSSHCVGYRRGLTRSFVQRAVWYALRCCILLLLQLISSPELAYCKSAKYRCCNVSHPTECIDRTIKTDNWFVRGIVPHILYLTLEILGVYIYKSSEAPRYPTGHFTNAAFLIGGAIIVLILRRIYSKRNRALREGERKWRL